MRGLLPFLLIWAVAIAALIPSIPRDEQPSEDMLVVEKTEPSTIIVHSESWCGPCQAFKRECVQLLRDAGGRVVFKKGEGKPVPRFVVVIDAESRTWTGYSGRHSFMAKLRNAVNEIRGRS